MDTKNEDFYRLGYKAVQSGESQPILPRNISPPSSGSKSKPSKSSAADSFMLFSNLAYSSILNM
jgi:hypothetical protein